MTRSGYLPDLYLSLTHEPKKPDMLLAAVAIPAVALSVQFNFAYNVTWREDPSDPKSAEGKSIVNITLYSTNAPCSEQLWRFHSARVDCPDGNSTTYVPKDFTQWAYWQQPAGEGANTNMRFTNNGLYGLDDSGINCDPWTNFSPQSHYSALWQLKLSSLMIADYYHPNLDIAGEEETPSYKCEYRSGGSLNNHPLDQDLMVQSYFEGDGTCYATLSNRHTSHKFIPENGFFGCAQISTTVTSSTSSSKTSTNQFEVKADAEARYETLQAHIDDAADETYVKNNFIGIYIALGVIALIVVVMAFMPRANGNGGTAAQLL